MKPKALTEHDEGMLEFLEDIIGTSQYKEPIAELSGKVENLNEIRGQKVISRYNLSSSFLWLYMHIRREDVCVHLCFVAYMSSSLSPSLFLSPPPSLPLSLPLSPSLPPPLSLS